MALGLDGLALGLPETVDPAQAQADAYRLIAEQIGKGNAAMVEVLRVIGDNNIQITPRVMVNGGGNGVRSGDAETVALIGTMLDQMVSRAEDEEDDGE